MLGGGPAYVFGSSGGAMVGLALVTAHPGQVRTLVAHEPPVADGPGRLRGVEAVADKDLTAALLGQPVGADALLLLGSRRY